MTTPQPVLVVHGVANRDEAVFNDLVRRLALDLALPSVQLVPVFWGDLGAKMTGLEDTLPGAPLALVRSSDSVDPAAVESALGMLSGPVEATVRAGTEAARASIAGDGFESRAHSSPGVLVRAEDTTEIRAELEQAWVESAWLKQIADEQLLRALGAAVAEGVNINEGGVAGDSPVRALRKPDIHKLVRQVVNGVDRAVGAVIGTVGAELNSFVRDALAPQFAEFMGDIFVYQRHRNTIHARIREVIANEAPGYGDLDKPIAVLAHSLGGVISFDLAVAGEPRLSIRRLITFGSQSPFFHILDPRGGSLAAYEPSSPCTLPETIGGWTNLWEPLDPLAFIASKVFRLASGQPPVDMQVRHLASSKLWTHSAYWRSHELVTTAREVLQ